MLVVPLVRACGARLAAVTGLVGFLGLATMPGLLGTRGTSWVGHFRRSWTGPRSYTHDVQIGVLGRLRVLRGGAEVDLGPQKQRALLAALALHAGEVVSMDRLADLVWGDRPPAAVTASVHGYVAALRRLLEPDRAARSAATVLLTAPPGYRLDVPASGLDVAGFTSAVEAVHRLAPGDVRAAPAPSVPLEELLGRLDAALALWRGPAYAELDGRLEVEAERARLTELHRGAVQDRARILLALGRAAEAAADLTSLVQRDPLREDVTALLAVALARSGRQVEALQALRTHRQTLVDELGLDPGPALQDLELALLRQDPSVVGTTGPADVTAPTPASGPALEPAPAGPPPPDPAPTSGLVVDGGPPLVGRDRELAALEVLLDGAESGRPQLAVLVGEAGIGKTRLVAELSATARGRGFLVLSARCSSDEGAPPLWPWVGVLRTLGRRLPEVGGPSPDRLLEPGDDGRHRYRLFDEVLTAVEDAARRVPVLLALDDLHWADASTLRLVQHLAEDLDQGRLALLVTRRPFPEPSGPLADLGAAMARRQALRLDVDGLTTAQVRALADARGETRIDADQARRLRDRTGGNPFYVVELLRWRESAAGRDAVADAGGVPAAVGDVIAARVAQLPADTQQLLRTAAALNRHLDVAVLAALDGRGPDDVLDALEPAMAGGLVVVDPADRALRFSHALVKDAVAATDSPVRRQRRHARLAQHLAARGEAPEQLSEIAVHWLQAGPAHAGQAWRAAARAAAYATSLTAHEEAAELLAAAVAAQRADPEPGWEDRYDLLMTQGRACRAAADSEGQRAATAAAVRLAAEADAVGRLALAAVTSSEGALWSNRPEGEVDAATVDALHRAAAQLPGEDTELRCQVFLALSRELFWAPGRHEAEAYAEQALAMARRLAAPRLRALGCQAVIVSALRPATLAQRVRLAEESVACARTARDPELEAVALFWQAVVAGEDGRMPDRDDAVLGCRRIAQHQRLRYLQVMLGCYDVPWLALQGEFAEAQRELEASQGWAAQASFPFRDEALVAAQAWLALWRGQAGALLDRFQALDAVSPTDMGTALLLLLLRSGRLDEAAALLDQRPVPLVDDDFAAPLDLAIGAEAALLLHRPALAAAVYPLMSGWAGRASSAGTGAPLGPVDAFLALAAAAVGETGLASAHADEAARLCQAWGLVPVAAWFAALRERFAF
ncbi:Predicted ATPase [Friedmanniella luteola]|uniref:Predicted ATPase n=1 Tax=Friedmanniella luteola TaxID=546871 RepID=A0A1H1MTY5_9ACTN|nr:BTAD domain-containing putative transcriptional regulator [Friedmanniella luteola]SDR89389.1 Predicted ATPase [Friedmanniella luteola]